MKTTAISNTGVSIPALGLGTVKLGRNQGVKYPESFAIPDDKQAADLLALSKGLGINFLDTAPAYGNSEERLGKLLKGQRQDWVICTKTGEEFENGQSHYDFSPPHTRQSIERSLRRLNTDYLDMVLIHSDGNDLDILNRYGTLDTLEDLKKQGLIRAIGMSTKTIEGGLLAAEQADVVMVTYHIGYEDEKPVLDYCATHNKTALVKKAFASGHLSNSLVDNSANEKKDPAQQSLEFVFQHPGVSSVIVGTINPDHLRHNAAAVEDIIS